MHFIKRANMKKQRLTVTVSKVLITIVLGMILAIGLPIQNSLADNPEKYEQLIQAYQLAVQDAADAQENEIDNTLWSITLDNPDLIWRYVDEKPQVLVVAWTSWDGYDDKVGKKMELSREVWITPVPQLQNFASQLNLSEDNLTLRIEQYLGLPPNNGKTKFVQMWVDFQDLFRPCPDPEINDTSCDLTFPSTNLEDEHQKWIDEKMLTSYGDNGYPWTRLGYTYDWGTVDTEIGASEFLVRAGAEVEIDSVINTIDYVEPNVALSST